MGGSASKTLAVAGLGLLAAVVLAWSSVGQQLDAYAYDFLLRLRMPEAASGRAVIVALDEVTLRGQGGMADLRSTLDRLLRAMAAGGARVVALDVQLADRSRRPETDGPLSEALRATPNLVLATNLVEDPATKRVYWEDPTEEFRAGATLGHVHADPDPDGVSRKVLLEKAAGGARRWALALEAFRLASGASDIVETEQALEVGSTSIPTPGRQRILHIRFLPRGAVERISALDLISGRLPAQRLRDRVAFVGVYVQGGPDRLMTPYSALDGEAWPGVEIHAQIFETLAGGKFLTPAPGAVSLAVALVLALALAACFQLLSGARAFALAGGLTALGLALPYALLASGVVLPFSMPAATASFCFLGLGTRQHFWTRKRLGAAEAQRDRYQKAVHYVTHEIRTPLTAIQGSSELMTRYALSEEKRREMASLIHNESRRLGRMIEMFLSVERLSAGQLELRREAVSVAEVVSSCLERAQPLAESKQIRLRLERSPAEEAVPGDREFLEYACYNLLTNAIKYSPAGTEIVAGVQRSGDAIRLSVQDQGYGMDAQEVKRAFQRFYRTNRAQQSGETGVGLGLALVEEIAAQHGGSVEVESRVNQGSRFTLVLPRAADRVAQATG